MGLVTTPPLAVGPKRDNFTYSFVLFNANNCVIMTEMSTVFPSNKAAVAKQVGVLSMSIAWIQMKFQFTIDAHWHSCVECNN